MPLRTSSCGRRARGIARRRSHRRLGRGDQGVGSPCRGTPSAGPDRSDSGYGPASAGEHTGGADDAAALRADRRRAAGPDRARRTRLGGSGAVRPGSCGRAIATATRVLAALRDEGLVRVPPGSARSYWIAGRRRRRERAAPFRRATPRSGRGGESGAVRRGPCNPGRLCSSAARATRRRAHRRGRGDDRRCRRARRAVDAAGRQRARRGTDVALPARHRQGRPDPAGMLDATLREARLPAVAPPGWRPCLEVAARSLWAAFRRHPWLAPALSLTRPQAIAGGFEYTEWVLAALADAGLTTTVAFEAHLTLFTFVRGLRAPRERGGRGRRQRPHQRGVGVGARAPTARDHRRRPLPALRAADQQYDA